MMFKKFVDNLTNALGITSNKISEIIKESNQYINALENVAKEVKKTVAVLESYAETETPSLGQAIGSLASTFDIIEKERQRQLQGVELIASENFVSDQVLEAMGSCLTNKYA
ncbi:MAG: hypothetical protein ACFE9R_20425, partial [Candidatus Hermodarchaeota archaeon]